MSLLDRLCGSPLEGLREVAAAASDADEREATALLEELPIPLRPREASELGRQRRHLRRFLAERAARRGDPEPRGALADFAAAPTGDGWDALMRFCPEELVFERTQQALRLLRTSGADLDAVYLAVAPTGVTSELAGMVEDGLVSPSAVERSLGDVFVSSVARGTMLMSAALGAQRRGDRLGVVRLVRSALASGAPEDLLQPTLDRILEDADDELRALLP